MARLVERPTLARMPEKESLERARKDKRRGQAATTQAGEFIREEIRHVRKGKHGARSAKQAIAIGLSKARKAGVKLPPPAPGKTSAKARQRARHDYEQGQSHATKKVSPRRSAATLGALEREGKAAGSHRSLSRQARGAAAKRSSAERTIAARKASRTKGKAERSAAAKKAARTRAHRGH
jgi:hypothetical protein